MKNQEKILNLLLLTYQQPDVSSYMNKQNEKQNSINIKYFYFKEEAN